MDYKIITDGESFLKEKENWNSVCDNMVDATPFQTWEWNYIWWKNNEPLDSLFIIKAFEDKRTFGYAPVVVKNNTAEFIGGRDMDYGRFVVSFKVFAVIEGFINILLEKGFTLALQEMASRGSQLHMVQKLLENKKRVLVHKTTRTTYIDLNCYESFDSYFKLLSKSMRNKTIKVGLKKNLLLQKESVTEELLLEIRDIYLNRQEARIGESDITWAFPIIKEMSRSGLLNVYMARDAEKAVGFLVSMNYRNAQYIWLVAFKMEYHNSFPGQLLFYQSIKDGFEDGNKSVDFMRGDYDFKLRWECSIDTNYTAYVFNNNVSYWKYKILFSVKPRIKKIIFKHPALERIYKKNA